MRVAALLLLSLAACPPPAVQPVVDASDGAPPDAAPPLAGDAADTTGCADACANLARLRCPDGLEPNCVATCVHAQLSGLTDLHTACLARAVSLQAAIGCHSVKCFDHDGGLH